MSRLPFELALALRYLRPRRTPVSIITLICVLGVMLGVAILIIVISVMTGFGEQLRERVLGFKAHLKVEGLRGPLGDWRQILARVQTNAGVRGVAPYVLCQVLVETQPADTNRAPQALGMIVRGIDPRYEGSVSVITNRIVEGAFDVRGENLLVGIELAGQLGLHVGDRLAVYTVRQLQRMNTSHRRGEDEMKPAADFTVKGIFDVGHYEYNSSLMITSLANAQDFQGLVEGTNDFVHGLHVTLHDSSEANTQRVANELQQSLKGPFAVETWMQDNATILGAVAVEKDMMYYLLFFIMIVAAFCIICSQLAFVMQKTREIGVLKSLGATTSQVITLFLAQSSAVGFSGVLLGVGGGLLAVHFRNDFLFWLRRVTGRQLFPAEIYNFNELPALVNPADLIVICGVSLVMCLLAGMVPAWIAASLKPVQALRHE